MLLSNEHCQTSELLDRESGCTRCQRRFGKQWQPCDPLTATRQSVASYEPIDQCNRPHQIELEFQHHKIVKYAYNYLSVRTLSQSILLTVPFGLQSLLLNASLCLPSHSGCCPFCLPSHSGCYPFCRLLLSVSSCSSTSFAHLFRSMSLFLFLNVRPL